MGAAAYNRGSRLVSLEADEAMPAALARSERQTHKDEIARLRARVAKLEADLKRARRCLAAERIGRERLAARLAESERAYEFGTSVLCRIAFQEEP